MKAKAVLVATIGTRDLMLQVSSGEWYNIGDDRMRDGDIIGEQAEVISELSLSSITYRDLTQYLLEQIEIYQERIKPVIIGKLLNEKAAELEKVYLIGTDQKPEVPQREKDTIYACELIKRWLAHHYPEIVVEIIHLGMDGTNPSNFEQMFHWWRQTWRETITINPQQPIWVCLKGGVGQASEASRISGLSLYGEQIQFFEFKQNTKANQAGIPSDYTGPFLGTNYLWDRAQQQALRLLEHYDYAGVLDLLESYFQKDTAGLGAIPPLVKAGLAWNQGEFETFVGRARSSLTTAEQRQGNSWWWMAYEQAYLGVVRLKQQNTTEAMLHSYRAVEGVLSKWSKETFSEEVTVADHQFLMLHKSILNQYPALRQRFDQNTQIELKGWAMQYLLEAAIPRASTSTSQDFRAFWISARQMRNNLSHRLGGLPEREVFHAWQVRDEAQWEKRILNCLNLVTRQSFRSLSQASLFAKIHDQVVDKIRNYSSPIVGEISSR